MTSPPDPPPALSAHVEETIHSVEQLRVHHRQQASPLQRFVDRLTATLGRPMFAVWLTVVVLSWLGFNLICFALGHWVPDPPPFFWLGGAASLTSLYLVVLVLASQRREDELAQHRELLSLELAILGEQKTAKVIQLLEEFRRDNPNVSNRVDREAEIMAQPADPGAVLEAIRATDVLADQ